MRAFTLRWGAGRCSPTLTRHTHPTTAACSHSSPPPRSIRSPLLHGSLRHHACTHILTICVDGCPSACARMSHTHARARMHTHAHKHAQTHRHTHTHTLLRLRAHTHKNTHARTHARARARARAPPPDPTHTHTHTHTHTYALARARTHMHARARAHLRTHARMHTHSHTRTGVEPCGDARHRLRAARGGAEGAHGRRLAGPLQHHRGARKGSASAAGVREGIGGCRGGERARLRVRMINTKTQTRICVWHVFVFC